MIKYIYINMNILNKNVSHNIGEVYAESVATLVRKTRDQKRDVTKLVGVIWKVGSISVD